MTLELRREQQVGRDQWKRKAFLKTRTAYAETLCGFPYNNCSPPVRGDGSSAGVVAMVLMNDVKKFQTYMRVFFRTLGWFVHHCEFHQLLIYTQNVTYEGQIKFGMEKILNGPHGRIISVTYGFLVIKKKSQNAIDLMQRKD